MDIAFAIVLAFLLALVCVIGAIVRPRARLIFAIIGLLAVAALLLLIHVLMAGGVLVSDPEGRLTRAEILSGDRVYDMRRLGLGYRYGEPQGDGHLRLTYKDGKVVEGCYVTHGMPMTVDATPPLRC